MHGHFLFIDAILRKQVDGRQALPQTAVATIMK